MDGFSFIQDVNLTRIQVLAPVLIAYRVSTGDAWSRNTAQQATVSSGPFVVKSGGGSSRTALGSSGGDIIQENKGAPV
jgi:hypothetical protein